MSTPHPSTLPIEKWDVFALKPYPLQKDGFFPRRNAAELQQLADHIALNGLDVPLDILPDGTVISGHTRLHVLRYLLHRKEAPVRVRHDLHALGKDACDHAYIEANLVYRQMSVMTMVRAYSATKELARRMNKRSKGAPSDDCEQPEKLRDAIAKRFGLGGRQLDRLTKLLKAPPQIQDAVDAGKMTQGNGLRVAAATPEQQARIVELMRDGKPPKKAVREVLGSSAKPTKPLTASMCRKHWQEMFQRCNTLRDAGELAMGRLSWYFAEPMQELVAFTEMALTTLPKPTAAELEDWQRSKERLQRLLPPAPEPKVLPPSENNVAPKPPLIDPATGKKLLRRPGQNAA